MWANTNGMCSVSATVLNGPTGFRHAALPARSSATSRARTSVTARRTATGRAAAATTARTPRLSTPDSAAGGFARADTYVNRACDLGGPQKVAAPPGSIDGAAQRHEPTWDEDGTSRFIGIPDACDLGGQAKGGTDG